LIVEDGTATGLPANTRTVAAGRVLVAVLVPLKVSQRKRGLAPSVKPKCADVVFGGVDEQRFIDAHVPGSAGRAAHQ
jgi:hypothetical protein